MVIYESGDLNVSVAYENRGGFLYLWAVADGVPSPDTAPDAMLRIPAHPTLDSATIRAVIEAFADGVAEGRKQPEAWEPAAAQWPPRPDSLTGYEFGTDGRAICPECGGAVEDATERCACPA